MGIVKTPLNRERDDQPRSVIAMCVGRDRQSQKSLKVLVLGTQQVIHVVKFTMIALTDDIVKQMGEITGRDPDIGEDLLADDSDASAEEPVTVQDDSEPTTTGLVANQDWSDYELDERLTQRESAIDLRNFASHYETARPSSELPERLSEEPSESMPAYEQEYYEPEPMPEPYELPEQQEDSPAPQPPLEAAPLPPVLPAPSVEPQPAPAVARKTRQPQAIIPTDRLTRSMTAALPAKKAHVPVYAKSYQVCAQYEARFEIALQLTIKEASDAHGAEVVEAAILDEIRSLVTDTSALEPCFTSERQLPMHLLLKAKFLADASFDKYKARIVIGGNLQHRDADIDTSSFCVRVQSILMLLGLAHVDKLKIKAVDIKTAYLHATVESKVYGRMNKKLVPYLLRSHPHLAKWVNPDGSMSFKVLKAVYGLAEASRLWYLHLIALLGELGYKSSVYDKGVLFRHTPHGPVYIMLHVDDMLVLTCRDRYWIELKNHFKANLRGITAQEGPVISFVALHIHQHLTHIDVDRHGYINKLSEKRGVVVEPNAKNQFPMRLNALVSNPGATLPEHAITSPIMELRYLDDVRPDVKFATSFLTMNMSQPTELLERQVGHLLDYLTVTNDYSIRIAPSNDQIHAYVDASYALHEDSRSHYGVAICMGDQGYAFHSKSAPIKVICRSSTEAEIHAANEAISDTLHAIDLLTELGHPQNTVVFYEDNQAVISLMIKSDFNFQTRSKHIRVKYDFLKAQVRDRKIKFVYIPTDLQLADVFTKPLIGEKFQYFRDCLLGRVPSKPLPPPQDDEPL